MKTWSRLTQDEEYRLTRAAAWWCWGLAVLGSVLRTTHVIGIEYGLIIIILMGMGIFFAMSLSRFKQSATIREVFLTGLTAATSLSGRTEAKLRELHSPTSIREDIPVDVCHECAQRWPCRTKQILDGEDVIVAVDEALTHPGTSGSI